MIYNVDREMVVEKNSFISIYTRPDLPCITKEFRVLYPNGFCNSYRHDGFNVKTGYNWNNMIMGEVGRYVLFQRHFMDKHIKISNEIKPILARKTGEIKVLDAETEDKALWVCSWFSTNMGHAEISLMSTSNGTGAHLAEWNTTQYARLPDYQYYLANRPDRVNIYLDWIRNNIHDKDKFLKGIDQAFKEMIDDI